MDLPCSFVFRSSTKQDGHLKKGWFLKKIVPMDYRHPFLGLKNSTYGLQ